MSVINVGKWIGENEKFFLPPVCNKMMHNGQLKVMYIGGPNTRKDYHIEEGEELFYMVKGDMYLKVLEQGKHKDIVIQEGEVFLLPAQIPHSPQRFENTCGLVIERERHKSETDGLRYYVGDTTEPLFERWFYCEDLGKELVPIIHEYFASEEHKTQKPNPEKILKETPFPINLETKLQPPVNLDAWLNNNTNVNRYDIFQHSDQSDIKIFRTGSDEIKSSVDNWIWQKSGDSTVKIGDDTHKLSGDDSLLIEANTKYTWNREINCVALKICQERKLN